MKNKFLTRAIVAAALLPMLGVAAVYNNGSKTTTFDVTLKIIADCTIAANGLDFGQTQGVLATNVSINTTLQVTCTNTTPYNIGLNAGTGTGSTTAARVMTGTSGNSSTVSFNLYQAAGNTIWGNTQGTDTKSGVGSGVAVSHTVYGVVPAQATPQPDTYKSTITATVYF
ncbi:fimbrial major subunit CsuA/B family protein [Pseudoduganella sp. FT25W]|uniref:Fimbrial major subunit CsuA/B family protein n=1 Tax=Duganella alba TaxID=2666081 RepID=A0A6L5QGL3_9BURK|nr:spore coat U domain-containing protein [Duganella alba]MRX08805.1 fimbrial major subunit CsuA/B family protein [Duganella alba]MRX18707.1 fimbrial major subunit CsuA/B family protein [Duganella alba]